MSDKSDSFWQRIFKTSSDPVPNVGATPQASIGGGIKRSSTAGDKDGATVKKNKISLNEGTGQGSAQEEEEEQADQNPTDLTKLLGQFATVMTTVATCKKAVTALKMWPKEAIMLYGRQDLGSRVAEFLMDDDVRVITRDGNDLDSDEIQKAFDKSRMIAPVILVFEKMDAVTKDLLDMIVEQVTRIFMDKKKVITLLCSSMIREDAVKDRMEEIVLREWCE